MGRLVPADAPRPARRAQHGHVDHCRLERGGQGGRDAARRWTRGRCGRTARRSRPSMRAGSRRRSFRSRRRTGCSTLDEHPRRDTSLEKLASLKPLHPEIEGFSITAGNACGANDAAAVLTIASDRLGLPALATVRSWASVGVDPAFTGLAPVEAIPKALEPGRTFGGRRRPVRDQRGVRGDVRRHHQAARHRPRDRVNVSGSGCSLGHPVAATGARMLVTLVHELRRRGGGIGVAAMCAGGGMGSATVIEVPRSVDFECR